MRPLIFPLSLFLIAAAPPRDISAWRAQAEKVSITREDFGIAHVSGPTDADAVFGMIYAQAEDYVPRMDANYLTALGRTAEAEGESLIAVTVRSRNGGRLAIVLGQRYYVSSSSSPVFSASGKNQ